MGEKIEDGGPAFPSKPPIYHQVAGEVIMIDRGDQGLSIRDYFAAAAMNGMLSDIDNQAHANPEAAAVWSYEYADAMLAARTRPTNTPEDK